MKMKENKKKTKEKLTESLHLTVWKWQEVQIINLIKASHKQIHCRTTKRL